MFTPPFLLRLQPRCCARPDATPPLQPPALPAPTLPSKSVATATATAIAQPEQPQPQLSLSAHLGALAGVALATAAAVCSISRYRRSQRPQQQQQQQQQQLFKDQREEARANEQVFSADGRNGASLEIGAAIADGLVAQGEWWLQAEALFLLLLEEGGEQGLFCVPATGVATKLDADNNPILEAETNMILVLASRDDAVNFATGYVAAKEQAGLGPVKATAVAMTADEVCRVAVDEATRPLVVRPGTLTLSAERPFEEVLQDLSSLATVAAITSSFKSKMRG